MFLLEVVRSLRAAKVPFAIVGGYAVSLHGALRMTFDIDIVIEHSKENFLHFEQALQKIGLKSRLPLKAEEVYEFKEEYIVKRNLIAWSFVDSSDPLKIVDLILNCDLVGKKSINKTVEGQSVPILSKADLIRMKELSGRAQDLEDVSALRKL